jgi:hypothetical protein
MDLKEIRQDLIKLFDSIEYDKEFVEGIKAFINSYDGTNVIAFSSHMFQVGALLMRAEMLAEKARGYDEVNENDDSFGTFAAKLKEDFERINQDLDPLTPSQSTQ